MNYSDSNVEREYWEKIGREEPLAAITKCEEAAKQLIGLTSLLSTVYLGIVSFGEILKQPLSERTGLLYLLLPLVFWLGSLILATQVIIPRSYKVDSSEIQNDYVKISRRKYALLRWSYFLLILSIVVLTAVIVLYLLTVPPPLA
jgi:hypothetical protein